MKLDDETKSNVIDKAIRELCVIGRYDHAVQRNLQWGIPPVVIRNGVNPFRLVCGTCAWTFWVMTDLSARGYNISAFMVAVLCSTLLLLFVYGPNTMKEGGWPTPNGYYLFASSNYMYCGLAFALISNHPLFFNDLSVSELTMSIHTVPLMLTLIVVMLLVNVFVYSGAYKQTLKMLSYFCGRICCCCSSAEDPFEAESRRSMTPLNSRPRDVCYSRESESCLDSQGEDEMTETELEFFHGTMPPCP
jgi:hypothetical protein